MSTIRKLNDPAAQLLYTLYPDLPGCGNCKLYPTFEGTSGWWCSQRMNYPRSWGPTNKTLCEDYQHARSATV